MKMRKRCRSFFVFIAIVLLSALFTVLFSTFQERHMVLPMSNAIIHQENEGTLGTIEQVDVLYYKNRLLGVLHDSERLDQLLNKVYREKYEKRFSHTKLGLSVDIYRVKKYVIKKYENKDDEILSYIEENDLFSIESNQIRFSNGSVMYVEDLDDYEKAKEEYILNFVDKESYRKLKNKESIINENYGSYVTSFGFEESVSVGKGYTSADKVLQSKDEIVRWFFNGYDPSKVIYRVVEGDTVQGVASKNALEVNVLLAMNEEITDENQLLPVGMKVNVKGITSPLTLKIEKQAINKVTLYPDLPQYIEDETLALGVEKIVQEESLGYQKEIVEESYENGKLVASQFVSSSLVESPKRKIIRIGVKKSDDGNGNVVNVGERLISGSFRYPLQNPSVTCGWQCYRNHNAMDVKNRYDYYGDVLAADSGTIIVNEYHPINGYYMEIDHGNGFVTYYGHMNQLGYYEVGTYVEKGEVIGQIGMTGVATGPHIHFEIRYRGEKVDPMMYLK